MRFPVRILALTQLVALALAVAVSFVVIGPPVFSRSAAPDLEHVAQVYAHALEARALRLLADLGSVRNDATLASAVETLDGEAIASAMRTLCGARKLSRCEAYDDGGAPLASLSPEPSTGIGEAERLASGTPRVEVVTSAEGVPELRVVGVLGDVASRYGYLRLGTPLDDAFAAEVARLTGHDFVLRDKTRVLAVSSTNVRTIGPQESLEALDAKLDRELVTAPQGLIAQVLQTAEPPRDWRRVAASILLVYAVISLLAALVVVRRFVRRTATLEHDLDTRRAEVTRVTAEAATAQKDRQELEARLERLSELLAIEDGAFALFVKKVSSLAAECQESLSPSSGSHQLLPGREDVVAVLRHLHTVKSHARLLGLGRTVRVAREAEELASRLLREGVRRPEEARTLQDYVRFVVNEVESYASLRAKFLGDVRETVSGTQAAHTQWLKSLLARLFSELNSGEVHLARLSDLHGEYRLAVACVGKEDLTLYVERFDRMMQDLAQRHGKLLEPLALSGNARFFDLAAMEALSDILIHCLRNALDHGIEAPAKRRAGGKGAAGRIVIESRMIDRMASVTIRDDGRGLDRKALEEKLVKKGAATAAELAALDDLGVFDRLFAPGVTTAESVTELSGRGVGLDVVRDIARKLGGDARILGAPGQGSAVEVFFPVKGVDASSRVTIFSLECELRAVKAEHAGIHGVEFVIRGTGFAAADRMVFAHGLRQLVRTAVASTTRPATIELTVATAPSAAIEVRIGVSAPDEGTYAETVIQQVDDLALAMLEGGIYAEVERESQDIVMSLPAASAEHLATIELEAILVTPAAEDIQAKLARIAPAHLGAIPLHVRTSLPAAGETSSATATILVIDEHALAGMSAASLGEALGDRRCVVIVQCAEIAGLATGQWPMFETEPLLVDGAVDESAVAHVLEASLALAYRRVMEMRVVAPGLRVA